MSQHQQIADALAPVVQRMRSQSRRAFVIQGLLVGAAIATACGVCWMVSGDWWFRALGLLFVLAGPIVAFLRVRSDRDETKRAANVVDEHYQWNDATLTAFDFSQSEKLTPLQKTQVDQALSQLPRHRRGGRCSESASPTATHPGSIGRHCLCNIITADNSVSTAADRGRCYCRC